MSFADVTWPSRSPTHEVGYHMRAAPATDLPIYSSIDATSDLVEVVFSQANFNVQVFTRYVQGREECRVIWRHSQNRSEPTCQEIGSIVTQLVPGYPDCPINQVEQKYASYLAIFRRCSGKNATTNEENKQATKYVLATRIIKAYNASILPVLLDATQVESLTRNVLSAAMAPLFPVIETIDSQVYQAELSSPCKKEVQKKSQTQLDKDLSGLPDETLIKLYKSEAILLSDAIELCGAYISSIPKTLFSVELEHMLGTLQLSYQRVMSKLSK